MSSSILLCPGPVTVSSRVLSAIHQNISHRDSEYLDILEEIKELTFNIFAIDNQKYGMIFIPGSGTAALEAVISSAIDLNEKILIINNGIYGERFSNITKFHKIPLVEFRSAWNAGLNVEHVENVIKQEADIKALVVVHHETSNGLLNPVEILSEIAKKYNLLFIVDTISSFGGEQFDLKKISPDITIVAPHKCIQSIPGINVVIINKEIIPKLYKIQPRTLYLNLLNYYASQERKIIPFTHPVQATFALRAALNELKEETLPVRIQRYKKFSSIIRNSLTQKGFTLLFDNNIPQSNTVTTVKLPHNYTYDEIFAFMKSHGYILSPSLGDYKTTHFRIANMGCITEENIKEAIELLSHFIHK